MKKVVTFAAAIEIPTGLVMVFDPSLFMRLLFGPDMSGSVRALGPLAGFALFALVIASMASAVWALLAFSLLCVVYLAYLGVCGIATGVLLWPAAAGHALVALPLLWGWLATKGAQRGK